MLLSRLRRLLAGARPEHTPQLPTTPTIPILSISRSPETAHISDAVIEKEAVSLDTRRPMTADRNSQAAPSPERPVLFPVRVRAGPGREYGALLAMPGHLDGPSRRARLLAVRGILHARQGRPDAARVAFVQALSADTTLDFAALPTFWDLPRAGCQAAVSAYEEANLPRQAVELQARLTYLLRPRAMRPLPHDDERRSS